tara:strand:+ start:172 stop:540 length:369 start_codon:yes stop_codon:yes gene_type:complete
MIIFQSIIKELDVNTNKHVYYLVTGNDKQEGIRFVGENVISIRMKKAPGSEPSSFWLDEMFKSNAPKFESDLKQVKHLLERGAVVVFSPSFLGEDIDKMRSVCPDTTAFIEGKLASVLHDKH